MTIIIIGPNATGKTKHAAAFARHFGCEKIVDDWNPREHEFPTRPGRLLLTSASPEDIAAALKEARTSATILDITTARLAIGLPPHAPSIAERFTR